MFKPLLKSTLAFAAAIILFASCKKDKDVSISKESIAGSYKLLKVTFSADAGGGESTVTEYYVDACEVDDVVTLAANGDFTQTDAGVSCGNGNYEGEWNLASTTSIEIDGETFELFSYDGSTLVYGEAIGGGNPGKLKIYMKKQ